MARSGLQSDVRRLTLTALCSRPLTLPHVSLVAAAIGHGIESADRARSERPAREGLREALAEALVAIESVLPAFIASGGKLSRTAVEDWRRAAGTLRSIAGDDFGPRVRALEAVLGTTEGGPEEGNELALGLLAGGALLGLLAAQGRNTAAPSKAPRRKSSSARLASTRS